MDNASEKSGLELSPQWAVPSWILATIRGSQVDCADLELVEGCVSGESLYNFFQGAAPDDAIAKCSRPGLEQCAD